MNKITVIGDTNSGKTCFLCAMFNYIAMGYIDGFNIVSIGTQSQQGDKLERLYERLSNSKLGINRFPPASKDRETFLFSLQYGYREVASFEWADYPGNYIDANGDTPAIFIKDLQESDTWVIFVDGETISEGLLIENPGERKRFFKDQFLKYHKFMGKFPDKIPGTVSVIVTKCDLLYNMPKYSIENGPAKLNEDLEMSVRDSLSSLFHNNGLKSISVVTLGDSIANNNYTGQLDPINIEYPITLSILGILCNNYDVAMSEFNSQEEFINKEGKKFFPSSSTIQIARLQQAKINEVINKIRMMAEGVILPLPEHKKIWNGRDAMPLKKYYIEKLKLNL